MGEHDLCVNMKYGWRNRHTHTPTHTHTNTDTHTDTHTDIHTDTQRERHISAMTRPDLGTRQSENVIIYFNMSYLQSCTNTKLSRYRTKKRHTVI